MTYKTNNYYWDSVANRKPVAPQTPAQRADRKQREAAAIAAYVAKYGHSPFKRTKQCVLPTLHDGELQMSNLFSTAFDLFMICISAFAFMCGCMSVVYMLLHWS